MKTETVDEGDHEAQNDEPEKMRKLFLGGLNYETTDDGLMEYFKKYGKIVDVIVMKFPDTRRSRGFGFVTFSTAYETETCFQDAPHTIDGTTIETKRATPKDEMADGNKGGRTGKGDGGKSSLSEARRKVFVGGLSYSTTDEGLREYFSQFGELVDSIVMKFRGFGFVTYASEAMVDECQNNRPHKIDGAVVETKRATPKDDSNKDYATVKKIFVGGLKDEVDNSDLRDYFSRYGTVSKVEQMTVKATGKKRGFGFVQFEDYDSVDKALLEQNHTIKNWRIDIKKAVSKEHMGGRSGDDDDFRGPRGGGRNFGNNRSPAPWGRWSEDGSGGNFGDGGFGGGNGGGQFGGRNQGFGGQTGGFGYGSGQGGGPWDNNQALNPWQGGQNDGFGGTKSSGFLDNQGGNWGSSGVNRGGGGGGGFNNMSGGFRGNPDSGGGFGDGGYGGNRGGGMGGPMRNQMGSGNRSSPYSLGGARGGGGGGYDNRGGAGGRW